MLAQSYVHETSQTPGVAAEAAAERKTGKYSSLTQSYLFVPVAAETVGAICKDGMDFLSDLDNTSQAYVGLRGCTTNGESPTCQRLVLETQWRHCHPTYNIC